MISSSEMSGPAVPFGAAFFAAESAFFTHAEQV